jgi:glycosyltransferase involved in cell wall biosynthesis
MARFNFILPFLPTKPVGGVKNLFQFANRLALRGHQINVICSVKRPFKKNRTPVWIRVWINRLKTNKIKWFSLDESIAVHIAPEISDRYVPDAEATLSTWWQMAYTLPALSKSKGKKVNFIQDYETWTGQEDAVHQSYKLPVTHVVIATYLEKLVNEYGQRQPILVNTPIDTSRFRLAEPIEHRSPASVMMMFSEEPRKGSKFGLSALTELKSKFPNLKATLFSVYHRPDEVPSWIIFHRRPENLVELYNQHAIFVSPSLGEGWALPPAEAMACGCAVVCTDIGGHRDYAVHNETALLVAPQEVDQMVAAIERLIKDDNLRIKIAQAGLKNIQTSFSWEVAVDKLEAVLMDRAITS